MCLNMKELQSHMLFSLTNVMRVNHMGLCRDCSNRNYKFLSHIHLF